VGTASPRSLLSFGTADTSGTNGINLYDNGGNYRTGIGATSSYLRLYTPSDGSLQLGRLSTSDGSTFLEAARIDSSGRLGIGTTSPEGKLEVSAGNAEGLRLSSPSYLSTSQGPWIAFNGGPSAGWDLARVQGIRRGGNAEGALVFYTNNGGGAPGTISEKARIDETGRLLVGTSTGREAWFNSTTAANLIQIERSGVNSDASISMCANSNGANGAARVLLGKTRGSSVGATTVVTSGDLIGAVSFQGADGTELVEAASIEAYVDGTPGANDMPGRLVFSTTADGAASPTERLRITSAGLVGIGTSGPQAKLSVSNSGAEGIEFSPGYASGISSILAYNRTTSAHTELGFEATQFPFRISGTERMRLDSSSSRLGIGTTSPGSFNADLSKLVVGGGSGSEGILVYSGTSSTGNIAFHDNADTSFSGMIRYDHSSNAMSFWTNGVNERARIDSSGRLLVGTSSYSGNAKLVVSGRADGAPLGVAALQSDTASPASGDAVGSLIFNTNGCTSSNAAASITANRDGGTWTNDSSMPGRLVFSTTADGAASPTERMRISANGVVSIGTTGTSLGAADGVIVGPLESAYTVSAAGQVPIRIYNKDTTGTRYCMEFRATSSAVGSITHNGSATAYNTSSDYRLKENVVPVPDGIIRLQQLKPSRFNFIADPDRIVDGFLAHEVQTIVPEAITGEKDAVDDEGNPEYQGIDQSKLVPLLTAALQEAIGEIESLKARLTAAGI
jgi:hypothetical protein